MPSKWDSYKRIALKPKVLSELAKAVKRSKAPTTIPALANQFILEKAKQFKN